MKTYIFYCFIILLLASSCGEDFLDHKYDQSNRVPNQIVDFQAIMDDATFFNNKGSYHLANIGSDEFSLSDAIWSTLRNPYEKNGYYWADDVYQGMTVSDWNTAYHAILRANLVLDGLENIKNDKSQEWQNVRAQALFVRSFQYFNLLQLFAPPFRPESADQLVNVPLRLESDITESGSIVTLKELYGQLVNDLIIASENLPVDNLNLNRASKVSALVLLAKCYLMQYDYANAEKYCKEALDLKSDLIDYNTLPILDSTVPTFKQFPVYKEDNIEVLYRASNPNLQSTTSGRINISTELLGLFETDDLRRKLYFNFLPDGRVNFKGSYVGSLSSYFVGLAVDEVYLIYTECLVRNNKNAIALTVLNTFRKHRIAKSSYKPITNNSSQYLLKLIIEERRKELILRGRNWEDMRRLGIYPEWTRIFKRVIEGKEYELKGTDNKATWPIPDDEIEFGVVKQNSR